MHSNSDDDFLLKMTFSRRINIVSPVYGYADPLIVKWCKTPCCVPSIIEDKCGQVTFKRSDGINIIIVDSDDWWNSHEGVKVVKTIKDIDDIHIGVICKHVRYYKRIMEEVAKRQVCRLIIFGGKGDIVDVPATVVCHVNKVGLPKDEWTVVTLVGTVPELPKVYLSDKKSRVIEDFEMLQSRLGNYDLLRDVVMGKLDRTREMVVGMTCVTNCCNNLVSDVKWPKCFLCTSRDEFSVTPINLKREGGFIKSLLKCQPIAMKNYSMMGVVGNVDVKPAKGKVLVICCGAMIHWLTDIAKDVGLSVMRESERGRLSADVRMVSRTDTIETLDYDMYTDIIVIGKDQKTIWKILLRTYSIRRRENAKVIIV